MYDVGDPQSLEHRVHEVVAADWVGHHLGAEVLPRVSVRAHALIQHDVLGRRRVVFVVVSVPSWAQHKTAVTLSVSLSI